MDRTIEILNDFRTELMAEHHALRQELMEEVHQLRREVADGNKQQAGFQRLLIYTILVLGLALGGKDLLQAALGAM